MKLRRSAHAALGLLMVALGVIGAFLPVMPSTIFFILGAFFFSNGSPRMERWLLEHPRWGPPVKAWRESGSISVGAKRWACAGMFLGGTSVVVAAGLSWASLLALIFLLGCAIFVLSRPSPPVAQHPLSTPPISFPG